MADGSAFRLGSFSFLYKIFGRPYSHWRHTICTPAGLISFKANGTLTICADCSIDVSHKGPAGGASQGRRPCRRSEERGPNGGGVGGGRGGGGCHQGGRSSHGAGGGGGSFRTSGSRGTGDRMRQEPFNEISAYAGRTYGSGSPFWQAVPPMGSGGGAGGLGHLGGAPIGAPGSGGRGGGAIQIAAAHVTNEGTMEAAGRCCVLHAIVLRGFQVFKRVL